MVLYMLVKFSSTANNFFFFFETRAPFVVLAGFNLAM